MDERRSTDKAAGPSDTGSQMLMANSERQWVSSYDLNYNGRESQQAVDRMPLWRGAMLDKSAKKLKAVSTPPSCPAMPPAAPPALGKECSVICISSDEEE